MNNTQFHQLVAIVGKHYGVAPERILSKIHKQYATAPRNIVATLWSRGATLSDTAKLIGWKSTQQVCHARSRVEVLSQMPCHAHRLRSILEELEREIPWLVATDALETPNPQKDATDEERGAGEK